MSARPKRADAGAAVAGLFSRATATGGLAGATVEPLNPPDANSLGTAAGSPVTEAVAADARVRLGVELTDGEIGALRALGRPARTGGPRSLGAKFVGTGVLRAAIGLLHDVDLDMSGIAAGDLEAMTARARDALIQAATQQREERP